MYVHTYMCTHLSQSTAVKHWGLTTGCTSSIWGGCSAFCGSGRVCIEYIYVHEFTYIHVHVHTECTYIYTCIYRWHIQRDMSEGWLSPGGHSSGGRALTAKVRGPQFNPGWLPVFYSSLKIFVSLFIIYRYMYMYTSLPESLLNGCEALGIHCRMQQKQCWVLYS